MEKLTYNNFKTMSLHAAHKIELHRYGIEMHTAHAKIQQEYVTV